MSRIENPCKSLVVRDKVLASSPWLRLYTRSHLLWNNIVCYKHDFWTSTLQVAGNTTYKSGRFHRHQHKSGCLGYFEYALYMASECRMHVPTHCCCSIDILWRDKVTKHTELRFRNHRCSSRSIECMGNSSSIIPETNIEELEFRCLDVLHYCERLLRITPIRPYRRPVVHVCHVVH